MNGSSKYEPGTMFALPVVFAVYAVQVVVSPSLLVAVISTLSPFATIFTSSESS